MKLNRITLRNFKGIEALDLNLSGNNASIFGENGTGKTTIADAYAWVAFGKSFLGDSIEPEIKRRDPKTGLTPNDGGVVHSVEAEFLLDDGKPATIKKEYVEKWEKKRGAAESEFRGHTTNYYVNDVPVIKREYEKKVSEFIPEEVGRLLSVPLHFCTNLNWKDRRKILMEICGDITDATILKEEEFQELETLLAGKSIDDFRKTTKAQIKKVNDELKTIPARIDELTKMEKEKPEETKAETEKALKELKEKRKDAEAALAMLENGGEVLELKKKLSNIEARITKIIAEQSAEATRTISDAKNIVGGCETEIERLGAELERIQDKIKQLETTNETTDKIAQDLRETWGEVNARQPNVEISDVCPCCGQKLPPEKIEEARQKEIEKFNLEKSNTLSSITEKGKRMMAQKTKNEEEISALKKKYEEKEARVNELSEKKQVALEVIERASGPVEKTEELTAAEQESWAIREKIVAIQKGDNLSAIEEAKGNINAIDQAIALHNETLAAIQQEEIVKKRKDELKAREKELGKKYSELERALNMAERFIRRKVELTEESINSHFKYVRFVMFREQINGGLEECCEPTINGVPFGEGLNTGAEMKAALDILNTLSRHYELNLPVFIDNCESYTNESIINVENQVIRLIVSEGQKALAIEVDGQEKQEIEATTVAA